MRGIFYILYFVSIAAFEDSRNLCSRLFLFFFLIAFLVLGVWFALEALPLCIRIRTVLASNPKWFHLQ